MRPNYNPYLESPSLLALTHASIILIVFLGDAFNFVALFDISIQVF